MGYCFGCGKLRETHGGWCEQCRADMDRRETDRREEALAERIEEWRRRRGQGTKP